MKKKINLDIDIELTEIPEGSDENDVYNLVENILEKVKLDYRYIDIDLAPLNDKADNPVRAYIGFNGTLEDLLTHSEKLKVDQIVNLIDAYEGKVRS